MAVLFYLVWRIVFGSNRHATALAEFILFSHNRVGYYGEDPSRSSPCDDIRSPTNYFPLSKDFGNDKSQRFLKKLAGQFIPLLLP